MTNRRRTQTQEDQAVPPAEADTAAGSGDKLAQAKAKLARMEETNRICFRHRADFARIEEELKKFKFSQAELDHILEPKGAKNIPGFSYFEMESQRQFINRLTTRSGPAESHAAGVDESRQNVDELAR